MYVLQANHKTQALHELPIEVNLHSGILCNYVTFADNNR